MYLLIFNVPIELPPWKWLREEHGMAVDTSLINRWASKFLPLPEKIFHRYQSWLGKSWRMGEAYLQASGFWQYLYRAADKVRKRNVLASMDLMHLISKGQNVFRAGHSAHFKPWVNST